MLEIISGINKFLSYLDISTKYLNRAYTLISILPTLYIMKLVFDFYKTGHLIKASVFLFFVFVLIYFIILNTLFYFFDKNVKWDVTQLFTKYLPEEIFNIVEDSKEGFVKELNGETLEIEEVKNSNVILSKLITQLIDTKEIETNDLSLGDNYLIPNHTLFPYYHIEKITDSEYHLFVGDSYSTLEYFGKIVSERNFKSLGLFILGGNFKKDGIHYKEHFKLKLVVQYIEDKKD